VGTVLLFLAVSPSPAPRRDDVLEERVQRWLELDCASGRASPAWRDVERQIDATFHPTLQQITRETATHTLIKQFFNAAPEPTRADGTSPTRGEQIASARRAYEQPRSWKRVELESEVDDGKLIDLRVVFPSGQKELDRAALDAVRKAIERRPPREGHQIARWSVEASPAMKLPAVGALVDETSGHVVGAGVGLGLSFDESGLHVDVPFRREVHTRVTLLSVRNASRHQNP
jgi:TonB family protein